MKIFNRYLVLTALAAATLLTYANSIGNGFVWDDMPLIVNNPVYKDISYLPFLLTSSDTAFMNEQTPYYRPLNNLTLMLDYQLYGLRPHGYHVENVLFHLLAVLLLYVLMYKLFLDRALAFMSSLIFAVHPINVEAVALIFARNNILPAVFMFLSFITYINALGKQKMRYFFISGFFFFLSSLSKESALLQPLVLFLYDFKFSGSLKKQIRSKIFSLSPFVLFAAVYIFMRAHALSGAPGIRSGIQGLGQRMLLNLYIIPKYLLHLFFPLDLSILYAIPESFLQNKLWLLCVWTIIALSLFLLLKRRNAVFNFGLLWLAVNFIPVSNIIPISGAPMADRFMYMPAVGLYIITAECFCYLYTHAALRKTVIASAAVIVLALSFLTMKRNLDMRNDISLFKSMVRVQPNNPEGHYNLGSAYLDAGDLSVAEKEWKKTLKLNPKHEGALVNLGNLYNVLNEPEKAKNYYQTALDSDSPNPVAHYNLARTLEKLGERDEAIKHYEMFLKSVTHEFSYLVPKAKSNMEALKKGLSGTSR